MKKLLISVIASLVLYGGVAVAPAQAQEPFTGQIQLWGTNFCPRGWSEADGKLLPIAQNTALFSLYGTIYGGDGRTTFALPNLNGRFAVSNGRGPGLSDYRIGERGGSENASLSLAQLGNHSHTGELSVASEAPDSGAAANVSLASGIFYSAFNSAENNMGATGNSAPGNSGGNQPVNKLQPVLAMKYCVALVGLYPSRS